MSEICAWVINADDHLLFEIAIPSEMDRIEFVHVRLADAHEVGDDDPVITFNTLTVASVALLDRAETLAQQLANDRPDIRVYRVQPNT